MQSLSAYLTCCRWAQRVRAAKAVYDNQKELFHLRFWPVGARLPNRQTHFIDAVGLNFQSRTLFLLVPKLVHVSQDDRKLSICLTVTLVVAADLRSDCLEPKSEALIAVV